jgi:hypothetical protein
MRSSYLTSLTREGEIRRPIVFVSMPVKMPSRQLLRVEPAITEMKAFNYMPSPSNVAVSLSQYWPITRSRHVLGNSFIPVNVSGRFVSFRFLTQSHGIKHNSSAKGQDRPSTTRFQPIGGSGDPAGRLAAGAEADSGDTLAYLSPRKPGGLSPHLGRSYLLVVGLVGCFVFIKLRLRNGSAGCERK